MKRWFLTMLALGMFSWTVQPVAAQAPLNPPVVSPWVQLRGGAGGSIGTLGNIYYNQVKPEFAFRGAINNLQQSANAIQEWQTGGGGNELPATGHVSGFQTHMRYFANLGSPRPSPLGGGQMINPLGNPLATQVGNQTPTRTGGR